MSEGNNKNYTDEELVAQMQQNIETGLALVMEQYAGLVWTICSNYLQNPEDMKECVNDTFAEFALNYERFKTNKGSLRNYLCKIAQYCSVDKFRSNLCEKQKEDTVKEKLFFEKKYGTGEREVELLDAALNNLAPIDNQILRMKYYDGMTFKEVADKLQMDYEVVKKRSQRSYKKLLKLILLGLLLGILAACATVIFRQYRFSELLGFIWSTDYLAYGLEEETDAIEIDEVSYKVSDAVYYDGLLQVEITTEWMGQTEFDWSEEYHKKVNDFIGWYQWQEDDSGYYRESKSTYLTIGDVETNMAEFECGVTEKFRAKTVKIILKFDDVMKLDKNGETEMTLVTASDTEFQFRMTLLPLLEYKNREERIQLSDGSSFVFGPNHTGDDTVIISFYHMNGQEYEVSSLISNNYRGMGTWNSKIKNVVLIDKEGNETSTQRIMSEDSSNDGVRREFQLYFPKVKAGTYTLQIPYLCLSKDMMSETVTLELPMKEGEYKEYNTNVLFPDGSGYRISGIRCEKNIVTWENYDFNGNLIIMEDTEWKYYFTYETISTSNVEFCFAEIQVRLEDGMCLKAEVDVEGNYYLSIKESNNPVQKQAEFVEIQLMNPVYVLDEKLSTEITLK